MKMSLFPEWQELKDYIEERGGEFDYSKMGGFDILVEQEFATFENDLEFYKHNLSYLYHLTAFGLDQWKHPYFVAIRDQVKPPCDVLDYGCGIGADGLRLERQGFTPSFADFDSECAKYLKWRLERRGVDWPVYDVEKDDIPRHSFLVALDVVEHIPTDEQWKFVQRLAEMGQRVAFNVPHGDSRSTLHYRVDVLGLVKRMRETFNLFYHRVFNEFQHFVIFDTSEWYSTTLAAHPELSDWVETRSIELEEVDDGGI